MRLLPFRTGIQQVLFSGGNLPVHVPFRKKKSYLVYNFLLLALNFIAYRGT